LAASCQYADACGYFPRSKYLKRTSPSRRADRLRHPPRHCHFRKTQPNAEPPEPACEALRLFAAETVSRPSIFFRVQALWLLRPGPSLAIHRACNLVRQGFR
jgi:hypothetical protein